MPEDIKERYTPIEESEHIVLINASVALYGIVEEMKAALEVFLHSLPAGCRFNIGLVGS